MIYSSVSRADVSNRGLIHHYISQPHNLDAKMLTHDYLFVCMLSSFSCFCCRLLPFLKIIFFKKFFQERYHSVKIVWIQVRSDIQSVLIWVQTVSKGYQVVAWNELSLVDTNEACCQKSFFRLCFQLKLTPDSSGHSRIQKDLQRGSDSSFVGGGPTLTLFFFVDERGSKYS